jgi:hypothetical protein
MHLRFVQQNDYEREVKESSSIERHVAVRKSDADREALSGNIFTLRISLDQQHFIVVSVCSLSFCDYA